MGCLGSAQVVVNTIPIMQEIAPTPHAGHIRISAEAKDGGSAPAGDIPTQTRHIALGAENPSLRVA